MLKLKPRCKECGHRLVDGKCVNPNCIAVQIEEIIKKDEEKDDKDNNGYN